MEFRQLEVFVAIADFKSFSKAADYLYLSQSTVSSHLKNLEKELQKTLIVRSTKTVQLTDAGTRFLFYSKRILETKRAALDDLNSHTDELLHIGASTIPSSYLLPELLGNFHKQHPNTFFDITQGDSANIEDKVIDGNLEFGMIGRKAVSPELKSLRFCSDRLVIVTPLNSHFLALHKQKVDIRELLKEPIIMRERVHGSEKNDDLFLKSLGIKESELNVIARNNDFESIKQMIINGMGISILSNLTIKNLEAQGQVLVFPVDSSITRDFYIIYLKDRELRPIHQEFINYSIQQGDFI